MSGEKMVSKLIRILRLRAAMHKIKAHFDPDFYRRQSPDLAALSDRQAIKHYCRFGWHQYLDPSPSFSTSRYLEANPDVANAQINPFYHYLIRGKVEGREAAPCIDVLPRSAQELTQQQITRLLDYFDADFYSTQVPGLKGDAQELLRHYIETGWKKGIDPSPDFSAAYYKETYGDSGQTCPLVHFVLRNHCRARRGHAEAPLELTYDPAVNLLPHLDFPLPGETLGNIASEVVPDRDGDRPSEGLDLHWVIPDFAQGGGGHMTIFRVVRQLESFGHRCTIWIDRPMKHHSSDAVYEDIIRHFQCVEAETHFVQDGLARAMGDAVIATSWATAYIANSTRNFSAKYYFVQDHEPEFYPTGTDRYFSEQTYGLDLACICASPWLEGRMREEYGLWSRSFHLAYDRGIYGVRRENPARELQLTRATGCLKIAVYAREHTARRCVHLALLALARLAHQRDDFEVHFFGQENLSFHKANFRAVNHGVLNERKLAALYNECDLALCFSATNYSLVPQEMMACGLPVIELNTDSTRAIFPDGVVCLAGPDPRDICDKIATLLDDPTARAAQVAQAHSWVDQFSWEDSAHKVEAAIIEYLDEIDASLPLPSVARPRDVEIDVVIPTFNGIGEIEPVIEALRGQRLREVLQIHCIDSSSTDGTTDWLRAQPDIALTIIDKADFQHGRTRNQGVEQGRAPLIAFLTQDARPASPDWAGDIARMMRHYPQAAGLFGRHLPYPEHSIYVRQEIDQHFDKLLRKPLAVSRDTDRILWESGDRAWRQFLHFYSDNNSAMRRTIWQEMPYPELDYGEDQVWARDIIEAGHTKLYAPTASVYHSHDYDPDEAYERCKVEGAFFYTYFGYELGEGTIKELNARLQDQSAVVAEWGRRHRVPEAEIIRHQKVLKSKYHGWRAGRLAAMNQKSSVTKTSNLSHRR